MTIDIKDKSDDWKAGFESGWLARGLKGRGAYRAKQDDELKEKIESKRKDIDFKTSAEIIKALELDCTPHKLGKALRALGFQSTVKNIAGKTTRIWIMPTEKMSAKDIIYSTRTPLDGLSTAQVIRITKFSGDTAEIESALIEAGYVVRGGVWHKNYLS